MLESSNESSHFPHPDLIDKSESLKEFWENYGLDVDDLASFLIAIGMRKDDPVIFSFQVLLYNGQLGQIPDASYKILEGLFQSLHHVGVSEAKKDPNILKGLYGNFSGAHKLFRSHTTRNERPQLKKPIKEQSLFEITDGLMAKDEFLHHLSLAIERETSVTLVSSFWKRSLIDLFVDAPETFEVVLMILSDMQVIDVTPEFVIASIGSVQKSNVSELTTQTRKVASDTLELGPDVRERLRKDYENEK